MTTGVDLSKISGKQPKYWRGKKVAITDETIGVSQLLGARAPAAPKVHAYAHNRPVLKTVLGRTVFGSKVNSSITLT